MKSGKAATRGHLVVVQFRRCDSFRSVILSSATAGRGTVRKSKAAMQPRGTPALHALCWPSPTAVARFRVVWSLGEPSARHRMTSSRDYGGLKLHQYRALSPLKPKSGLNGPPTGHGPPTIRPFRGQWVWAGGRGSILSRMRAVSSRTSPTMTKLLGLSLSRVSCGLCQKTLLYP